MENQNIQRKIDIENIVRRLLIDVRKILDEYPDIYIQDVKWNH